MKYIKFIVAAFVAVLFTLSSTSVYAQEDGNRDANGYVVKGPYLTNGGGANWFVGIGGGVNTSLALGVTPFSDFNIANNWAAEAFAGKWFTPIIGTRIGYKGVMNNFGYDTEKYLSNVYANGAQVQTHYGHGDVMFNLSNAISGYKETRFWDIIPYVGAGYLGLYDGEYLDNKFGVSAGIYNEFRLGNTVNLYLDINIIGTENPLALTNVADNTPVVTNETFILKRPLYLPSATVGIAFNLGKKKNFDRLSSVMPCTQAEYDALSKAIVERDATISALNQKTSDLEKELANAKNRPVEVKEVVVEKTRVLVGSNIITFSVDSSVLTDVEKAKVEAFAKGLDDDTLVQIVGSADSKTGTEKYNKALAEKRAAAVKDVLVKNGVAADRINVSSTLDATENTKTSRSAVITLSVE